MKYPTVAKRFSTIMTMRNIKARELAKRTRLSEGAISHYVNGNRVPGNANAVKLSEALGCNPLWLMDLSDNMNTSEVVTLPDEHNLINRRIASITDTLIGFEPKRREHVLETIEAIIEVEKKNS